MCPFYLLYCTEDLVSVCEVLTEDVPSQWRDGEMALLGKKSNEKYKEKGRRAVAIGGHAGGSPQATSDIAPSDGLMRLP